MVHVIHSLMDDFLCIQYGHANALMMNRHDGSEIDEDQDIKRHSTCFQLNLWFPPHYNASLDLHPGCYG
jgi:hypothetical protein